MFLIWDFLYTIVLNFPCVYDKNVNYELKKCIYLIISNPELPDKINEYFAVLELTPQAKASIAW